VPPIRAGILRLGTREMRVDAGLSTLLLLQGFTLFVALPLGGGSAVGRVLLDACHLAFTVVCIGVLTRRRIVQAGLLATLALLLTIPPLASRLVMDHELGAAAQHETIALVAFAFNGSVTAVVARHVFAPGRVTVHRVRGAVLLYLNVAALFAIAYGALALVAPGAFTFADALARPGQFETGTAAFSYFSLATITTTGYGDIAPLHPLARSLANLEAVFGQLFPATLLTRLVSLHVAHERADGEKEKSGR
jgi:hypothetical protein